MSTSAWNPLKLRITPPSSLFSISESTPSTSRNSSPQFPSSVSSFLSLFPTPPPSPINKKAFMLAPPAIDSRRTSWLEYLVDAFLPAEGTSAYERTHRFVNGVGSDGPSRFGGYRM